MSASPVRVSVAIPVHNEEQAVDELLRRVGAVLDGVPGGPHEIVIVDDGSTDGTLAALARRAAADPRIVVVALSRNFGHQAAFTAALDHVTGDVTVLMDGDLQDPPEVIPQFLARHAEGFDVVYAVRAQRRAAWWLRVSYHLFYRVIERLSDLELPLDSGDFALLSRRVVQELHRTTEHNRYLRGLRTWVGFRQVGLAVDRPERFAGTSKYTLRRLVRLALDGIFAFSIVPLRAAAALGATAIAASALYSLYALYAKLALHRSPQGFTTLILLISFLSGVNLLFLGIIGEYLGRVYEEVKARPLYVVRQVIRRGSDPH